MTLNYKPAYPPEFRQQMVELVALGKSPKQLSKEFGGHYTSIKAWCRAAGVPIRSSQAIAPVSVLSVAHYCSRAWSFSIRTRWAYRDSVDEFTLANHNPLEIEDNQFATELLMLEDKLNLWWLNKE